MKTKSAKPKSLAVLSRNAWDLRSELTRRSEANNAGYCSCVSCGAYHRWKDMDAGHFIHAGTGGKQNPVSYDERNIHAQCRLCNRQPKSSRRHPTMVTIRYTEWMIRKYGPDIIDQLEAIKKQPWFRWTELEEKIELYKSKISVLERSKKWGSYPPTKITVKPVSDVIK